MMRGGNTGLAPLVPVPWEMLSRALAAAHRAATEEAVHQLRVATRRVDAWLRLARMSTLRADLRWLRNAAASARDLDVLLARDWPAETKAKLEVNRTAARRSLAQALEAPRTEALLLALRLLPPLPRARAERGVRRLAKRLVALRVTPTDPQAAHHRRRLLRRVRYARELVGHRDEVLIRLQDALGTASDLSISAAHAADADNAASLRAALSAADAAWGRALPLLERLT